MPDQPTTTDAAQSQGKTVLSKPANGETVVVDVNNAQHVAFDFPLDTVKLELRDVDLVVTFPDGSSIILVGFGLRMVDENAAEMSFAGTPVTSELLLSLVGSFLASDVAQKNMSSAVQEKPATAKDSTPDQKQAPPPPVEVIEVQAEPNKHKDDFDKKQEMPANDATTNSTSDAPLVVKKNYDEPASAGAAPGVKNDNTSTLTGKI